MSDVQTQLIEPLKQFYKDSKNLVQKCTKPDHKGTSSPRSLAIFHTSINQDTKYLHNLVVFIEILMTKTLI